MPAILTLHELLKAKDPTFDPRTCKLHFATTSGRNPLDTSRTRTRSDLASRPVLVSSRRGCPIRPEVAGAARVRCRRPPPFQPRLLSEGCASALRAGCAGNVRLSRRVLRGAGMRCRWDVRPMHMRPGRSGGRGPCSFANCRATSDFAGRATTGRSYRRNSSKRGSDADSVGISSGSRSGAHHACPRTALKAVDCFPCHWP
jgi:hypothetical protein